MASNDLARVTRGTECHGAQRPGSWGVGWGVVFKDLHISAKLKFHTVVVGGRYAGEDSSRAERIGDAIAPRELVQTPHYVGNHVGNQKPRKSLEW